MTTGDGGTPIQGIKQAEYVEAEKALGHKPDELPDGIKFYIRGIPLDIPGTRVVVTIYRVVDGGTKKRKIAVGKMENRPPEDHEIGEWYGPGDYVWIGKWYKKDDSGIQGEPRQMLSEVINIGPEWLAAHMEYRTRQESEMRVRFAGSAPVPVPVAAPAPAPSMGIGGLTEELGGAFMLLEKLANIAKSMAGPSPVELMTKSFEAFSRMGTEMLKSNMDMARTAGERIRQIELDPPDDDDDDDPPAPTSTDEPKIPEWLAPFWPYAKTFMGKIIGGGPEGAAAKTLLLSSDEFKTIFTDPEKWGQAVSALEMIHGTENTKKALDILLSKREPGAVAKGKKSKRK
jgi:hypothetical protein